MKKKKNMFGSLLMQITGIGMIFVGILIGSYWLTVTYAGNQMKETTLAHNEVIMSQTAARVQECRDDFYNAATVFSQSPSVLRYISSDEKTRVEESEDVKLAFSNAILLQQSIQNMILYDENMEQIANMGRVFDVPFQRLYMRTAMEIDTDFLNTSYGKEELYLEIFYPIYDLKSPKYRKALGMCVFVAEKEAFDHVLSNARVTEGQSLFLLDREERVIAFSGQREEDEGKLEELQADEQYYTQQKELAADGWKLVSAIPKTDLSYSGSSQRKLSGAVFATALVLFFLLIFYCYRQMVYPLEQISGFISRIVQYPQQRLRSRRRDEIGHVADCLDQMLDDNQKMQAEVQEAQRKTYETELARQQAQILAYRSQINPHFLYNTFACICEMAVYYDVEEIARLTRALSNVFRFAVKGGDMVTIADEAKHIEEYAKVIQYRFSGRIRIHVDMDERLREKEIPKLLLQPLVENAVFHGLEPQRGPGEVNVEIGILDEGHIHCRTEDNGCGIAPEKLRQIMEQIKEEKQDSGIGISNIYKRLQLHYGEEFQFEITSKQGEGTRIRIVIPCEI